LLRVRRNLSIVCIALASVDPSIVLSVHGPTFPVSFPSLPFSPIIPAATKRHSPSIYSYKGSVECCKIPSWSEVKPQLGLGHYIEIATPPQKKKPFTMLPPSAAVKEFPQDPDAGNKSRVAECVCVLWAMLRVLNCSFVRNNNQLCFWCFWDRRLWSNEMRLH